MKIYIPAHPIITTVANGLNLPRIGLRPKFIDYSVGAAGYCQMLRRMRGVLMSVGSNVNSLTCGN